MEINQHISKAISEVFDQVLHQLENLDEHKLNQQPADGGWSIGQTVEHILRSSTGIPDQKVQVYNRAYDEQVPALKKLFLDLSAKYQSDSFFLPRQENYEINDLKKKIIANKTKLIVDIKDKDLTLLCMDREFPQLGFLTRFEWLMGISTHIQRHVYQIERIRKEVVA